LFDLIRPTPAINVIQKADNFGKVQDVSDGIDFHPNARLARGILVHGGVSWQRERVNRCDFKDNMQIASVDSLPGHITTAHNRLYQTDIRVTKNIRHRATTIRPTVSIYNLFNANPTNTNAAFQTTYGTSWLAPTVIMTPRFLDFGVQVNF